MEELREQLQDSGLVDAHGNRARGIALEVAVVLLPGSPGRDELAFQETVWFCEGLRRGLLGQSSFFEQFGAIFLNFPQALEGRRFGLFKNALHP